MKKKNAVESKGNTLTELEGLRELIERERQV